MSKPNPYDLAAIRKSAPKPKKKPTKGLCPYTPSTEETAAMKQEKILNKIRENYQARDFSRNLLLLGVHGQCHIIPEHVGCIVYDYNEISNTGSMNCMQCGAFLGLYDYNKIVELAA